MTRVIYDNTDNHGTRYVSTNRERGEMTDKTIKDNNGKKEGKCCLMNIR